jgi:hypothetical protein
MTIASDKVAVGRFFGERKLARKLFQRLERDLRKLGPWTRTVSKSQIAYRCAKPFAWAWVPDRWLKGKTAPLVLSVALPKRDHSKRWKEVVRPRRGVWMHHLEICSAADLDGEVWRWLEQAYEHADASPAVRELILKLDTPGDRAALAAISRLKALGSDAVEPLLVAARDLRKPRIRKWAIVALGEFADPRARRILLAALRDPMVSVKTQAIRAVRRGGRASDGRVLIPLLQDEGGGVRVNAVDALAELGYRPAGTALRRCLGDEQWYVRQRAALALERLRYIPAVAELRRALARETHKAALKAMKAALASLEGRRSVEAVKPRREGTGGVAVMIGSGKH